MSKRIMVSVVLGVVLGLPFAGAQSPPPPQAPEAPPHFVSGVEVVAVDLVVRDGKGRLVTDLKPSEIEVLEDGVPQKLDSFRALQVPGTASETRASATSASGPTTAPAPAAGPLPSSSRRVVLVFCRLTSDGRRLAQSAGEEFAKKHITSSTVVSVVRIDGGLIPVLDQASDPAAVKEAVRKATAVIGAAPMRAGGPTGADTSYSGQQLARFQGGAGAGDMSQADSVALVSALITVVDGLRTEAGRKTVLLFSEGFAVAPGYEHVFADLQSRANRANVSFYGIDVRGLQLSTQLGSSGAALATTAAISAQQRQAGSDGGAVNREELTQDDTLQTSLRSDVVDTLGQLSTSTGGFLVTQTNDFGRPIARVAEDMRGYYEVSYVPAAAAAPGQFRKIEVRVARKDVRVQSRSGYYTTPPTAAGAFAAFAEAQLPSDFDVRSRFYRFSREGDGPFDCLVKIEASLAKAEFKQDPEKGRLTGRMTLAGRVLDGKGDVVDTFGQDVSLGGTPEQIQASRAQTLPLARRLKLPPGSYTVELLVRDAVAFPHSSHARGRPRDEQPRGRGRRRGRRPEVGSDRSPAPRRPAHRPEPRPASGGRAGRHPAHLLPGVREARRDRGRDRDRRGPARWPRPGPRLVAATAPRRRGADLRPLAHSAPEAAARRLRREGHGLEGEPDRRGDDDHHRGLLGRSGR